MVAETNLRDRFTLNYERFYFGPAMVSTVLALSRGIGTLLLPSSHSYAHLEPLGSHPLLDPRWSTEGLEVVHHGAEARRTDKTAALRRRVARVSPAAAGLPGERRGRLQLRPVS